MWVAHGPAERYEDHHPGGNEVAAVIEVADASLVRDRDIELPRYAAAGVPEVWIVSLTERKVHVYTDPDRPNDAYRTPLRFGTGDAIASAMLGIEVAVDDILPR